MTGADKIPGMFLSNSFLGIPEAENTLEKSRVVVLPVPYERTVSYGVGTRNGPAAILMAFADGTGWSLSELARQRLAVKG